jgi:hypothetical protein
MKEEATMKLRESLKNFLRSIRQEYHDMAAAMEGSDMPAMKCQVALNMKPSLVNECRAIAGKVDGILRRDDISGNETYDLMNRMDLLRAKFDVILDELTATPRARNHHRAAIRKEMT